MYFKELNHFIETFSRLPGIGEKSARRIAFHLLKKGKEEGELLANSIINLVKTIQFCKECGGFSIDPLCDICKDEKRDREILCIVEDPSDIFTIEATNEYKGLYHVLMGALSPLDGIGPEHLRFKELNERLSKKNFKECFIATNPTLEGDATADYIVKNFSHYPILFTRLSHGVATGTYIEFTDRYTLSLSIKNRQILNKK